MCIRDRMIMEQKIVNAMVESLEKEEFMVCLQPKVEIDTGKIIGAEALVRWNHPKLGIISPDDFIPEMCIRDSFYKRGRLTGRFV